MQYLWLAIASAGVVTGVGAAVGMGRSTGSVQRRALALSFGVLGFAGVVSSVVVLNGFGRFAWVLALLITVLPLVVYASVVATAGTEREREIRVRLRPARDEKPAGARSDRTAFLPSSDAPAAAMPKRREERNASARHGFADAIEPASAVASSASAVSVAAAMPTRAAEPAFEPALEPAPTPSVPPRLEPTPASPPSAPKAPPAPKCEPRRAAPPEPTPVPVPVPKPQPKLAPAAPSTPSACDAYFEKAVRLKDAGAFLAAARLFAESAAQADGSTARRHARFEELSCYVKAGETGRARALAHDLRGRTGTMTKAERIKLDAVLRML